MKKEYATYIAISQIDYDLNIDISFLDARVYTTKDSSKIDKQLRGDKGSRYLCISIEVQLEDFESVFDGAAYARPRLLIILGVLSFLTQRLLMSSDFYGTVTIVGALQKGRNNKFRFNKFNYMPYFNKVSGFIKSANETDKRLFYSLIDRYRKALFLEEESQNSMIHDDEVLLCYFHILELLSSKYYIHQKQMSLELINQFSETFMRDIYVFDKNQIQLEIPAKRKLVESIFISEMSVGSKIMYMLQTQNILTSRLKLFVSELIKDRNSVAHGRQVYQDRVIFPIPPFFPLVKNRSYSFEMLRVLAGRSISAFIGINHLKNKWEEISLELMPTFEELNSFIKEEKYKRLSADDFYSGFIDEITPYTISYYLLNNKLKPEDAIPVLLDIVINYRAVENDILQLILSVILIADKVDGILKERCVDIIKLSSKNSWLQESNMRDLLYYLEYLGHKVLTLRNMVERREVR